MQEIIDGVDQHTLNQDAFGLPSRLISKVFLFRAIYKGKPWTYANDPQFSEVSSSGKFWEKVIDRFYTKYEGIARYHERIMQEVSKTGMLTIPTGRSFVFERVQKRGEWVWPETDICNHPVQGLGAELVKEYRIGVHKRLMAEFRPAVLFSSIHDSLGIDTPAEACYNIKHMLEEEAARVPDYVKQYYKFDFNLPFRVEVSKGPNMYDLEEF